MAQSKHFHSKIPREDQTDAKPKPKIVQASNPAA